MSLSKPYERRIPPLIFLDIEASSLGSASYPIEVAWGDSLAVIESHLISPAGIPSWHDWSMAAERLHGIAREQLLAEGKTPRWVAERLNRELAGREVHSDNPDYDRHWLEELFRKAGGLKPGFTVRHVDDLLIRLICPEGADRANALLRLRELKQLARSTVMGRHRAGHDVAYLLMLHAMARAAGRSL